MTLASLAVPADLPSAWQQNAQAQKALDIASAAIRDAAGSAITTSTGTIIVSGTRSNLLILPGPVRDVTAVIADGNPITDFEILPNGLWRHCGWGWTPSPVSITYTAGLDTVPADIADLCCQLAVAWLIHDAAGGGSMGGLTSVGIDDARETYSAEAAGQVSPAFIPKATRDWLASRFGGGAVVVESL